jgi:hypothetical protein
MRFVAYSVEKDRLVRKLNLCCRRIIIGALFLVFACVGIQLIFNSPDVTQNYNELMQSKNEKLYYTDRVLSDDEISAIRKSKVSVNFEFRFVSAL